MVWTGWSLGQGSDLAVHKKLAVSRHFVIFLLLVDFDFHFILHLLFSRRQHKGVNDGTVSPDLFGGVGDASAFLSVGLGSSNLPKTLA